MDCNAPNLVGFILSEPEIAIGTNGDIYRTASSRRNRELGKGAIRSHAPDLIIRVFCKPEVAIGTRRDALWFAKSSRNNKLGNNASWCDASNQIGLLSEPEIAARSARDIIGIRIVWDRKLSYFAPGRNAPVLACSILCEPEIAIK